MPPTRDPARDLLFGLLALQTGLINQAQLVAAFHAWTQARDHPMAKILAGPDALSAPCLTLVEGLVRMLWCRARQSARRKRELKV